jgi:hypothetical protein
MINTDNTVSLFGHEFVIKYDTPTSKRMSAFYNDKRITVSSEDKYKVLSDVIRYYEDNLMELQHFIENINVGGLMWMDEDPDNRFVATFPEDVKYWNAKGISTVPQLRHYIDDELEFTT